MINLRSKTQFSTLYKNFSLRCDILPLKFLSFLALTRKGSRCAPKYSTIFGGHLVLRAVQS